MSKKRKDKKLNVVYRNKLLLPSITSTAFVFAAAVFTFLYIYLNQVIFQILAIVFEGLGIFVFIMSNFLLASQFAKVVNDGLVNDMFDSLNSLSSRSREIKLSETNVKEFNALKKRFVKTINSFKDVALIDRKVDESFLKFEYEEGYDTLITRRSFIYNLPFMLKLYDYNRAGLLLCKIEGGEVTKEVINSLIDNVSKVFKSHTYVGLYESDIIAIYVSDVETIKSFEGLAYKLYEKFASLKTSLTDTFIYTCKIGGAIYPFSSKDKIIYDCSMALKGEDKVNIFVNKRLTYSKDAIESLDEINHKKLAINEKLVNLVFTYRPSDKITKEVKDNLVQFGKYSHFETCGLIFKNDNGTFKSVFELGDDSTRLFKDRNDIDFREINPLYKLRDLSNCFFSTRPEELNSEAKIIFDLHSLEAMYVSFFGEDNNVYGMSYYITKEKRAPLSIADQELTLSELSALNYIALQTYHHSGLDVKREFLEKIIKRNDSLYYSVNSVFDLVELSDELKAIYKASSLGKKCYKSLFNLDSPCKNCPLVSLKSSTNNKVDIGSRSYERTLITTSSYLGTSTFVLEPTKANENSFRYYDIDTNLLSRSAYDVFLKEILNEAIRGTFIYVVLQGSSKIVATFGEINLNKLVQDIKKRIDDLMISEKIYRYNENVIAVFLEDVKRVESYDYIEQIHSVLSSLYDIEGSKIQCNFKYTEINFSSNVRPIDEVQRAVSKAIKDLAKIEDNMIQIAESSIVRLASKEDYIMKILESNYSSKSINFNIQPIYKLSSMRIISGEMLLRLFDVYREKMFASLDVVSIATKNKKMAKYDSLNYENASALYSKYGSGVFKIFNFRGLNINISSDTLKSAEWLSYVKRFIEAHSLPTDYLGFEISEITLKECLEEVKKWKEVLLGYKIYWSIDNYENVYFSPQEIKELGFNEIKISRNLLTKVEGDNVVKGAYESIVQESHMNELIVVAEGVETKEQLDYIKSIKVDYGQGYLLSYPKEVEDFVKSFDKELGLDK